MLERACRSFGHDGRQSGRSPLRNEDAMDASRLSGSDDGAQVLGIFDAVENDEKRRLALLTSQFENVFRTVVGFGRDKGNDPLMIAVGNQPVEGRGRLDVDRNMLGLGLLHQFGKLPISPLNEETLERPTAGTQGFTNGM